MFYTLKIQKLVNEAEKTEKPKEKLRFLKNAITIADENNDREWGYSLRKDLIDNEESLLYSVDSIPAFAWILQNWDADNSLCQESDFLWEYKWMLSRLYCNPNVSLEQIKAAEADFKLRLQRNGYSLRAYYTTLSDFVSNQQNIEQLEEFIRISKEFNRDEISDCEACEMDEEILLTLLRGEVEKAYEQAAPLLEKQYTCFYVPARTFVNICYYSLQEKNYNLCDKIYQNTKAEIYAIDENNVLTELILKFAVCAAYIEPLTAIEILEKYMADVDEVEDYSVFISSIYIWQSLNYLPNNLNLKPLFQQKHSLYSSISAYPKSELQQFYLSLAKRIADKLDMRDGSEFYNKILNKSIK